MSARFSEALMLLAVTIKAPVKVHGSAGTPEQNNAFAE
jgi:hypothetical protein